MIPKVQVWSVIYNTKHYYYLCLARINDKLNIELHKANNTENQLITSQIIDSPKSLGFKAKWDHGGIQFYWKKEMQNWNIIGESQDATILSDDHVREGSNIYMPAFTGSFYGVTCIDLEESGAWAKIKILEYKEL